MSEIRLNRLTGEWVIIAPERAKRGGNLAVDTARPVIPEHSATCPFCPGNEGTNPDERYRLASPEGGWLVRSVTNKFSALSAAGEVAMPACPTALGRNVNGVGLHEVLVEGPRHDLPLALFPATHVRQVLDAYLDRFRAFHRDPRVRHVIIFKNHGADAGASQQHPHSQIVGLPIVPGQVIDRLERASRFYEEDGRCLACTLIAEERAAGCRIVAENEHFVAFVPYAALSPYHLWIFPKVHGGCFSEQPVATFGALSEIMHLILAKVYGLLDNPPFNFVIRSLSPDEHSEPHFHWYISIVPRVVKSAGFELGTGMYINPSLPEDRARALREFAV